MPKDQGHEVSGPDHDDKQSQTSPNVTSRRLKKRELDRKAQRLAREKTKTRIADLEKLVGELRNKDPSGQVQSLTDSLQAAIKERDGVTALLRKLQASIGDYLACQESRSVEATSNIRAPSRKPAASPTENDSISCTAQPQQFVDEYFYMDDASITIDPGAVHSEDGNGMLDPLLDLVPPLPSDDMTPFLDNLLDTNIDRSAPIPSIHNDLIVPTSTPGCGCDPSSAHASPSPDPNLWRLANAVLTPLVRTEGDELQFDYHWQQDIPVRAVLYGWKAVEAHLGKLPPLWSKLRQIDENLFYTCGKVERLAILRLMHSLLLYHYDPSEERHAAVPPWYLERPSQAISHSYAIDFFVWPGLRERFVFYQHHYCANIFWHLFASCLRLLWPFELRDTYTVNTETGQFCLSEGFERRVRDINAWTMTDDIFLRWPELYSDIPAFPTIPGRQLSLKALGPAVGPWALPSPCPQRQENREEDSPGDVCVTPHTIMSTLC